MTRGLNRVMIIGHVGRDPEMRYSAAGEPVSNFSVGASHSWRDEDGNRQEHTEWFNVVAWGRLAEICNQQLSEGERVYVEGRLQTRQWEEEDGEQRRAVELVAREMIKLGGTRSRSGPR